MTLTGQLGDLSLSELIEFFCNQRKTGRLKVNYTPAPGVFFIKDGELVDAKVGALNGAESVYFALALPNASFDFSAQVQSSRRTINEPWMQVVLEGLRRIDEGILPNAADALVGGDQLDEATLAYLKCIEIADENAPPQAITDEMGGARTIRLSPTVETGRGYAGKRKMVLAGVMAAMLLACAVAAIPLTKRFARSNVFASSAPSPVASQPETIVPSGPANHNPSESSAASSSVEPMATEASPTNDATAGDAILEMRREEREREARARARKIEAAAKKTEMFEKPTETPAAAATGPKTVRVSVTYDEAGRVTQASVVGASPGAETYAATAVRIARGRHFTAGKAGSTTVMIPSN